MGAIISGERRLVYQLPELAAPSKSYFIFINQSLALCCAKLTIVPS